MEINGKEDKILLARAEEREAACLRNYMITGTEFLDLRQQSLVRKNMAGAGGAFRGFYGGYGDAERAVAVFFPEYIELEPAEYFEADPEENPLSVLRVTKKKGAPSPGHRDYLGALMGLGIRREVTGDILVREDGADLIVLRSMAEYIASNLDQAGRSGLTAEEVPVRDLILPESKAKEKNVSVASLRLDSVLGAAFGLSRAKSLEAVRSGIVFVNGLETLKPDYSVGEGDRIVMRHKGRVIVSSVNGKSSKGRTRMTLTIYR